MTKNNALIINDNQNTALRHAQAPNLGLTTYVLTVSEFFPKTHTKTGTPTEFTHKIQHQAKIHTIRGNYDLWEQRFKKIANGTAILSVRVWSGMPYKSKQKEIFRYDHSHQIGIQRLENPNNLEFATIASKSIPWVNVATNDGLSFDDFLDWFKVRTNNPMAIIHFTPFRY